MTETVEFLRDYRTRIDTACEELAMTFDELGACSEGADDAVLITTASKKLRTLHKMLLATGISSGLLAAVMSE